MLDIRSLIKKKGFATIDEVMAQLLYSHEDSYYLNKKTLGKNGDFITSPEISQIFGEIIGVWCFCKWEELGCPTKINLIELGPGRGLLMRDMLKVAKLEPKFYQALSVELLDINPHFIQWQEKNLKEFEVSIKWIKKIENIAQIPSIIIANEFFDTMPIKQYVKIKDAWYEAVFIIDPIDERIRLSKIPLRKNFHEQLLIEHPNAYDGAVLEESQDALQIIRFIADHIKSFSGAGLIIDYGYYISPYRRSRNQYNPTLQAIMEHKYQPLLKNMAQSDISAHIDFYALSSTIIAHGVTNCHVKSQREFLIENGIKEREKLLKQNLSKEKADLIARQVDRLIGKDQMGELFKALYFAERVIKSSNTLDISPI